MHRKCPINHIIANSKVPYSPGKFHTLIEWFLASTYLSLLVRIFCYIFNNQRSIMRCLFDPARYRDNLHSNYTRPYMVPYSGPCGNCHHKQTSPTVINPVTTKINWSTQPSMSTRIWTVLFNYLSIWEWHIETKPHMHGYLQLILNKSKSLSIYQYNTKNTYAIIQYHITNLVKLGK